MNRLHGKRLCARIGCGLVALCALGVARGEPVDILKACAARASVTQTGLEALDTACPQLTAALTRLGVAQWLGKGWKSGLDRRQIDDLASLTERYRGAPPQGPIDASRLPGILKMLRQSEVPAANSRWEAFKSWVSGWLSRLDRGLGRIAPAASYADALLYGLIGLVLIAAAAVVVNELRAAGILGRLRAPVPARMAGPAARNLAMPAAAIETLPIYEQPALLLRLLVRRLAETGRLERDRALTHDELAARGVFDSAEQRVAFRAVASIAARILYGAGRPPPCEVEPALAAGSALLATITASPGAAP